MSCLLTTSHPDPEPHPEPSTHLCLSAWEGVTPEALGLSYGQIYRLDFTLATRTLSLYLIIDRKQLLLQFLCHLTRDLPSLLQVLIFPAKRPKESQCKTAEPQLLRDKPRPLNWGLTPVDSLDLQSHQKKPRRHNAL